MRPENTICIARSRNPVRNSTSSVTALGASVVDMYVNDQLVGEERLGKEPPIVYCTAGGAEAVRFVDAAPVKSP